MSLSEPVSLSVACPVIFMTLLLSFGCTKNSHGEQPTSKTDQSRPGVRHDAGDQRATSNGTNAQNELYANLKTLYRAVNDYRGRSVNVTASIKELALCYPGVAKALEHYGEAMRQEAEAWKKIHIRHSLVLGLTRLPEVPAEPGAAMLYLRSLSRPRLTREEEDATDKLFAAKIKLRREVDKEVFRVVNKVSHDLPNDVQYCVARTCLLIGYTRGAYEHLRRCAGSTPGENRVLESLEKSVAYLDSMTAEEIKETRELQEFMGLWNPDLDPLDDE